MSRTLEQVIYDSLEDCGRKKSDVARDMGMPLATLSRKVAFHDDGAKLAVAELIPFIRATGTYAVLDYMADALGLRLVAKQASPSGKDLNEEAVQAYEAVSHFLTSSRMPDASDSEVLAFRRQAAKELDDVLEHRKTHKEASGFIVGHVCRAGKVRPDKVFVPMEEEGRQ